jgi:hypothetical protein
VEPGTAFQEYDGVAVPMVPEGDISVAWPGGTVKDMPLLQGP